MTIAACFEFNGGILFCADTKITREMKTNQTKILSRVSPSNYCASVFVLAGSVPYATVAIEQCESRMAQLDFLNVSMDEIKQEIESVLVRVYQTHIYPRLAYARCVLIQIADVTPL